MDSLEKALTKLASHTLLDICTRIHMEPARPLVQRLKNCHQANIIVRELQASSDDYIKGKLLLVHDTHEDPVELMQAGENDCPQYIDYMNDVRSYEMDLHRDLKKHLKKAIPENYQQNRCPLDNLLTAQKSITEIKQKLTELSATAPRLAILNNDK